MKIAIVGGGIGGLCLAYFLSQKKENRVFLYEKKKQVGGLLGLLEVNKTGLEGYYHHLFTSNKQAINLIKELGLEDKLLFLKSKIGVYYKNQTYLFSSPFDLLRFKPLPLISRLRLGFTIFYLQKFITGKNWKKYQSISACLWLKKFSGEKAYEIIWRPLLYGKFGKKAPKISLAWLWHRFFIRTQSRDKFGLKEELVYLKGGFKTLVTSIIRSIEVNGGVVKTGVLISKIQAKDCSCKMQKDRTSIRKNQSAGWRIKIKNKWESFDKVVFTTPIPIFLKMVERLPKNYVKNLKKIEYRSALSIVFLLKEKLMNEIYWLNIHELKMPFLAVVEHTNLVDKSDYGGENIVYIGNYLNKKDSLLKMKKSELIVLTVNQLKKINPFFKKSWIKKYWVFKDLYAQPVVTTNYYKYIPPFKTPIKNLYLMSMAQVYPEDRGINQAVRDAKFLADVIMK